MSDDQKRILEQQLWNIANTLRGKMNADEFRDYILGFIFYKYLSEKMEIFANGILKQDKIKFRDINPKLKDSEEYLNAIQEEALEKLGYFLKPEELFTEVSKRGNGDNEEEDQFDATKTNFILEDLQKILTNIQLSTMGTDSEDDFDNLFEDMDLNSTKLGKTPEQRNEIIAKVLFHLDKIDFKLENTELDVLGDAYEYLIGQFASGAGKKAGEFYTPQEVSKILAKIVTTGKQKLKSVYDPTCGSGSLLLRVAKEVKEVNNFYGQEMNRTTYNLARMNMILHGVHYRKFDIKQEDTLEHPQHLAVLPFEAIVANPPFSAKWSANPLFTSDDRFSQYGKLAPNSKADFAFVCHMIHHLAENGTMAVVLPHGVLYRTGSEEHIRKYLIENKNYLDAVIGLPANIFYGVTIPTCILVFKKCRENPNDVLFIDSSLHFEKQKNKNNLREIDIEKIISTYRSRIEIEKYSSLIKIETISENNYDLSLPKYIDLSNFIEHKDINSISNRIILIEDELENIKESIKTFCEELEVSTPFNSDTIYNNEIDKLSFNNNINNYPKWETKTLGELCEFENGKAHENSIDENGKFIVVNSKFISSDGKVKKFSNTAISPLEKDTIVMVMSDVPNGKAIAKCYYINENNKFTLNQRICSLKTKSILPKYLFYQLNRNPFYLKFDNGVSQTNLRKADVLNCPISYPTSLEEQTKIAEFMSLLDKQKLLEIEKINLLTEFKATIHKNLTFTQENG